MKAVNWTVIDWNQRTVDLAKNLGVSPSVVSYHRLKNHLRKSDRTNHRIDWSNVDWSQPNFVIAGLKSATPGAVTAARKEYAPDGLRNGHSVKGSHSKVHVRSNYKKREVKTAEVKATTSLGINHVTLIVPSSAVPTFTPTVPVTKSVKPSLIKRKLIEIRDWFYVCVATKKEAIK
jgi:hypothetical protein